MTRLQWQDLRCMRNLDVRLSFGSTWRMCRTHPCNVAAWTCRSKKKKKMLPLKKDLKYWTDSVSTQTSNTLSPFVVVICCSPLCFFFPAIPLFLHFFHSKQWHCLSSPLLRPGRAWKHWWAESFTMNQFKPEELKWTNPSTPHYAHKRSHKPASAFASSEYA